jgi:hypothetical protein
VFSQDPSAFLRHQLRVLEVVKNHRYENHIDRVRSQGKGFGGAACVENLAVTQALPCLMKHFHGRIDPNDNGIEGYRQGLRKTPCPASKVQDVVDPFSTKLCD